MCQLFICHLWHCRPAQTAKDKRQARVRTILELQTILFRWRWLLLFINWFSSCRFKGRLLQTSSQALKLCLVCSPEGRIVSTKNWITNTNSKEINSGEPRNTSVCLSSVPVFFSILCLVFMVHYKYNIFDNFVCFRCHGSNWWWTQKRRRKHLCCGIIHVSWSAVQPLTASARVPC